MTSVGRQFKTSQGSERGKKENQPSLVSSVAEIYKAKGQTSARDQIVNQPGRQTLETYKTISSSGKRGVCVYRG